MTSCRPRGAPSARAGAAVVVAAAVLLAGCGEEIPEALAEQATGLDVEIGGRDAPLPEGVETGESPPDDDTYPDALPEEFPLPGGMELVDSSVEETDDGTLVTIESVGADDFDATVLFYEAELPAADWSVIDYVEANDDGTPTERWEIEGFGWTGFVEVRQEGDANDIGGTTIRVLVELRGSG